MKFHKVAATSEFLSPHSFGRETQSIEYREDPLTGARCRINVRRAERLKETSAKADFSQVVGKPDECPFCPENVEQATPLFPAELCAEGRIRSGDCCFFPNLYPLAEYHATGTLTSRHFLELDQFEPYMLVDNLTATREYLARVSHHAQEVGYPIYLWNHLPPSAASMFHPHVQVLVDRKPTPYQDRLLQCSRDYFSRYGRSFWCDVVEEEKRRGERYIGEHNSVAVIAPFAPQGNREALIIFRGSSNLMGLRPEEASDFADCVVRLLRAYDRMGINSFNLCTFSARLGEEVPYYCLHAKLISRPVFQPFYRNDTGILERFHYEADIETPPEDTARKLKAFFEAG